MAYPRDRFCGTVPWTRSDSYRASHLWAFMWIPWALTRITAWGIDLVIIVSLRRIFIAMGKSKRKTSRKTKFTDEMNICVFVPLTLHFAWNVMTVRWTVRIKSHSNHFLVILGFTPDTATDPIRTGSMSACITDTTNYQPFAPEKSCRSTSEWMLDLTICTAPR
jgi:hypothetical protein